MKLEIVEPAVFAIVNADKSIEYVPCIRIHSELSLRKIPVAGNVTSKETAMKVAVSLFNRGASFCERLVKQTLEMSV